MKNKFINIQIIIFITIFLYSCQTAKDALQGKKRSEQGDEFLIKKKNPLAMPPDYELLPIPENENISEEKVKDDSDIKDILNINEENQEDNNENTSNDLEDSILDKIK